MDQLLKDITESVGTAKNSLEAASSFSNAPNPEIIQSLLEKSGQDKLESVSLLTLKNNALMSYLSSVALITLSHLERLQGGEPKETQSVIQNSVEQRVCLEKGVKPIEKKLGYQLDKMERAYTRMVEEEAKAEEKVKNDSDGEDAEDSEESDEELSYRPDASALAKMTSKPAKSASDKYKPPKISAAAPPSVVPGGREKPEKGSRKLQSMEEYLNEQSDMPTLDVSVGSTIVDHGRGGVKTSGDRKKEQEIQTYEENNFTRLPNAQVKKSYKQKLKDMRNNFAGEDWSMFSNSRDVSEGTSRKRKAQSTWDRIKKRK